MIEERCSCGSKIKTDDKEAIKLVREWRRKHTCQFITEVDNSPTHGVSDNQLAIGFQPGEMPAKEYDPWDE